MTPPARSYLSLRSLPWVVALLAIVATLPSLLSGYVYDDVMLIEDNLYVQDIAHAGRAFTTHFWDVAAFGSAGIGLTYYRPLVTLSYLANWLMGDGAAWVFHLSNVLCHGLCAYLVVVLGLRWLCSAPLAFVAGLVFALHGSRAESVVWIAGRTDVMMTLGLLLAVQLAALSARTLAAPAPPNPGLLSGALRSRPLLGAGAASAFVFALLCKETALVAPLLLGFELITTREKAARRVLVWQAGVWCGLGAAYVVVRALLMPLAPETTELSMLHGLTTLGLYLERIFWPWPQTFFFRPIAEVDGKVVFSAPHVAAGLLLLLAFAGVAWAAWRHTRTVRPALADNTPLHAACLWVLAGVFMGPLLNFTTTGIFVSTSDHFLYLPLWLLAMGVLAAARRWVEPWLRARVWQLLVLGASTASVGVLWTRSVECLDNGTLWARELELNPDNPFVLREVAKTLAGQGHLDEAQALFERSLQPASMRYVMLAPPGSNLEIHHRVVSIEAALRADGDVVSLAALHGELRALALGTFGPSELTVGRAQLGRRFAPREIQKALGKERMRPEWRAEAALVAARLCNVEEASAFLAAVPDRYMSSVVSPENLILSELRTGNFQRARRRLGSLSDMLGTPAEVVHAATIDELTQRTDNAETALRNALAQPEPMRSLLLGAARADLGLYLCALRQLRPLYEQSGPDKAPQYLQLLLAAGLPDETLKELRRVLPEDKARDQLAALRAGLSERLLTQTLVSEPSPWWPGPR
jgi:tetratricopeptide (TPR) repeat protein